MEAVIAEWGAVLVCALAVAGLLVAERRGSRAGKWGTKPLAAVAFVVAALQWGALDTEYGRWILAGLVLCAIADVLLIPKGSRSFLAGLVSFALGHLAYAFAFARSSPEPAVVLVAGGCAALCGWRIWRWLSPHLEGPFRAAVAAYVVIIGAMVSLASGASAAATPAIAALGAWAFAASDLSVARERFVTASFTNGAWGLPLYFAAQCCIARSVA